MTSAYRIDAADDDPRDEIKDAIMGFVELSRQLTPGAPANVLGLEELCVKAGWTRTEAARAISEMVEDGELERAEGHPGCVRRPSP